MEYRFTGAGGFLCPKKCYYEGMATLTDDLNETLLKLPDRERIELAGVLLNRVLRELGKESGAQVQET